MHSTTEVSPVPSWQRRAQSLLRRYLSPHRLLHTGPDRLDADLGE